MQDVRPHVERRQATPVHDTTPAPETTRGRHAVTCATFASACVLIAGAHFVFASA
jgi:hypothetical protein